MWHLRNCAIWGFAAVCLLLSPIVMIFGMALLVGAGLDVFAMAGEGPITLALCLPAALMLLHVVSPHARRQVLAYCRSRLRHYAP